ncbi:hypothetical protein SAMN05660964_01443 [Thiothrix caldifontis]|uniref:Uncharacterized protein n=1 Tax=Thiothrix caldifontis TaxID=525918 RepID=A0A1H4APX8_9GAMM|nr:hypothetical protein [Thiothrix caldifontis]SEA37777.1 hypothetical protein SAMN05660964_01443 [Thiothrix caldifontis]
MKQGIQVGGKSSQVTGIASLQPTYSVAAHAVGTLFGHTPADGHSRVTTEIELPANAIVKTYDLVITATRADRVVAAEVADLREAISPSNSAAVTVDFGKLRTVNKILLPQTGTYKVYAWLGMKFDPTPVTLSTPQLEVGLYCYSIPETRSERLLIELGGADAELFMAKLELSLPDLPADLSLRINGGTPVWQHPGTVQLGSTDALRYDSWTTDGQRLVSIASALADYSGDATRPEGRKLMLELTSSVPGRLSIAESGKELQLLHRLSFNKSDTVELEFLREGSQQLKLDGIPIAWGALQGLHLTLGGEMPLSRVLPPEGPEDGDIGQLVLGNGRAACVRLDGGAGLVELTGVRLPLSVVAGSAEARVMLWQNNKNDSPIKALGKAASEPVNMGNNEEEWVSFLFSKPVPFDAGEPPWAALIVSRGEVIWSLAAPDNTGYPVRIGSPEGPWRELPAVLGAVAGRLRLLGLAADTQPLAPLLVGWDNAAGQPVTPTAKGLRLELLPAPANANQLVITSRTAGTVTLSEVDAITNA